MTNAKVCVWRVLSTTALAAMMELSLPSTAWACGDPTYCGVTDVWMDGLPVPTDGVFAFGVDYESPGMLPPTEDVVLARIDVEVQDGAKNPVSGSLVWYDDLGLLVWRPDAPLGPGVHTVTVLVDNTEDLDNPECDPFGVNEAVEVQFEVTVVPNTTPPWLPSLKVESLDWETELVERLDTMVCCDGAYPKLLPADECGMEEPSWVWWENGFCAPAVERFSGRLTLGFDPPLSSPEARSQYRTRIQPTGGDPSKSMVFEVLGPTCYTPVMFDLRDGSRIDGEPLCITEDDVPPATGERPRDPSSELEQQCNGEPYTCEVVMNGNSDPGWSEDWCTPWSPPSDDGGTTTDTGGTDGTGGASASGVVPARDGCGCSARQDGLGGVAYALFGWIVFSSVVRRRKECVT